jgi:hypothetical protein
VIGGESARLARHFGPKIFNTFPADSENTMKISIIVVFIFLTLTDIGLPQKHPRRRAPEGLKLETISTYSESPIDKEITILPAKYLGHNPETLYLELTRRKRRKDEFETTEGYDSRVKREMAEPLIGSLGLAARYAIDLEIRTNSYDADKGIGARDVRFRPIYAGNVQREYLRSLPTRGGFRINKSVYEGGNRLGAKISVTKSEVTRTHLMVTNWRDWDMEGMAIPISFTADPETAREYKESLRLLAFVTLDDPLVSFTIEEVRPTFEKPEEIHYDDRYIHAKLLDVWLYHFPSGRIIKKVGLPNISK